MGLFELETFFNLFGISFKIIFLYESRRFPWNFRVIVQKDLIIVDDGCIFSLLVILLYWTPSSPSSDGGDLAVHQLILGPHTSDDFPNFSCSLTPISREIPPPPSLHFEKKKKQKKRRDT
ncbi:histone-binding protein RBBP4 [Striga asiatica]|uniref:Histone-binding protein RBBP4 n=1 Tax=Striga asiatica TaxID=4170 RepID=A0A5A7QIB3_STRAF|nr:histone-binding protein RBBP4 [Striga asiatica]